MDVSHYIGLIALLSLAGGNPVAWASQPPMQMAQDPGRQYSCYVQLPNGQVEDLSRWCGAIAPQRNPPTASKPVIPFTSNTNNGNRSNNPVLPAQTPPGTPQQSQPNQIEPAVREPNPLEEMEDTPAPDQDE